MRRPESGFVSRIESLGDDSFETVPADEILKLGRRAGQWF
jgi:hypothetical protein